MFGSGTFKGPKPRDVIRSGANLKQQKQYILKNTTITIIRKIFNIVSLNGQSNNN